LVTIFLNDLTQVFKKILWLSALGNCLPPLKKILAMAMGSGPLQFPKNVRIAVIVMTGDPERHQLQRAGFEPTTQ
jgi:hypothetical protein